tara:strand:+ start:85 stop:561 length:477 start_codon:yes stop_codon:yes gene_type:complete
MVTRSGGAPIRTNKVKPGADQAFTLPKGTSAAPIMNVPAKAKVPIFPNIKWARKGKTGGKRLTQAEKAKKSAADFVKRKKQLAGKKPKNITDFLKRRNKLKGVVGGKAAVIGGAGAAATALLARGHIKDLKKKKPKYGKDLTFKEKSKIMHNSKKKDR